MGERIGRRILGLVSDCAETFTNSLGNALCRLLKAAGVTRFHLVSRWRAFDIRDRRFAERRSFASLINDIDN